MPPFAHSFVSITMCVCVCVCVCVSVCVCVCIYIYIHIHIYNTLSPWMSSTLVLRLCSMYNGDTRCAAYQFSQYQLEVLVYFSFVSTSQQYQFMHGQHDTRCAAYQSLVQYQLVVLVYFSVALCLHCLILLESVKKKNELLMETRSKVQIIQKYFLVFYKKTTKKRKKIKRIQERRDARGRHDLRSKLN